MWADERIVLLALRRASERWGTYGQSVVGVADETPAFLLRTANGSRPQPFGEARTRKALRALAEDGYVRRSKGAYGRVRWSVTEKGQQVKV